MHCPFCGSTEIRVVDTNPDQAANEIKRRRECTVCMNRFTTVERLRLSMPLVIKQGAGGLPTRREPFDRGKLRRGVELACAKRPISAAMIDRVIDSIEARLLSSNQAEIASREIGEHVINALRELDEIAYIRYAIVFLGLEDLAAVQVELDRMLSEQTQQELLTQ